MVRPALDTSAVGSAKVLAMQVNMHEAKTRLSELVAAAGRGEEVLIARDGRPAARPVAVANEYPPVQLGFLVGQTPAISTALVRRADGVRERGRLHDRTPRCSPRTRSAPR
jgi:prevent-host-death family protein